MPPVRPGDDQELAADLAAARDVASRLAQAQDRGRPVAGLRQQQRRLEDAVRARVMRAPGAPGAAPPAAGPGSRCTAGRAEWDPPGPDRQHWEPPCTCWSAGTDGSGTASRARPPRRLRATELARSGLRRLAHSGPGRGPSADSAFALLAATGRQLEQTLLGDAVHLLGDGPVVIVPPGRFHAIPWALLPSLRYRAVSVAPSAHAWLRARSARPPNRRRVVLARGPGLGTEGAEVPALAPLYDDVTVLADTGRHQ